MTASSAQLSTRRRDGVLELVLDRPEKRNALDARLVAALREALEAAEEDPTVQVVGLRGAGPDFCSGADLSSLRDLASATLADNLGDAEQLGELFLQIRRMPKPVVALVRGRALAGGAGLATACDMVVAARGASFGYPESRIGFVPAMVMAMLRRNVSEKRAFDLIVRGMAINAEEAERIGLVNAVYEDDEFDARAAELLSQLAARSPTAVALCKALLYEQDGLGFAAAVESGALVNVLARTTPDARAGIARFLEKREGC